MIHFKHNPPKVQFACAILESEPIHPENGVSP